MVEISPLREADKLSQNFSIFKTHKNVKNVEKFGNFDFFCPIFENFPPKKLKNVENVEKCYLKKCQKCLNNEEISIFFVPNLKNFEL